MAIFDTPIATVPRGTSPNAGELLNTTGFNNTGGIFSSPAEGLLSSLLGTGKANSFYKEFYDSLLTTANAPPINSLWLVFIQDLPPASILTDHIDKDNSSLSTKWYTKASSEGRRPRGIILAQGVKHVGDGTKFSREGYANTGLWKGMLSNGRNDIEQLQISFLESNVSFVDYALRPWAIAVAHQGLTNPFVRANSISVWHLGKMGAGVNLARRKVITYHNCFPTSIDSQEYNYSGDDINIKRQVSFGFSHYTMENADEAVLNILTYGEQESGILGMAKSFLKNQANEAMENLQQQFGASSIQQYVNNIVERGKSFASSLISNTVQGAVTNVAGAIQGAVDGAIRDVTGAGFSAGVDAVNAIADATNEAVDSITGANPNRDTPRATRVNTSGGVERQARALSEKESARRLTTYGYVEKKIREDDTVNHIFTKPEEEKLVPAVVNVNKEINQNDVPNFVTDEVIDLAEGGIEIPRVFATGTQDDDTPVFTKSYDLLYYKEKTINEDDTPKYVTTLPNSRTGASSVNKAVDATSDSNISSVENTLISQRSINPNDSKIGDDIPMYEEKEIAQNDSDASRGVNFNRKYTNEQDSNPSKTLTYKEKTINQNDFIPN